MHTKLIAPSTIVFLTVVASMLIVGNVRQMAAARTILDAEPQAVPQGSPRALLTTTTVLTVAISSDVTGLDPAITTDGTSFQVAAQLYDTLVVYQPGTSVPAPGLAMSWTVSPDDKTWTFNLRPGLKFHDNTALDATAIAYNFNRWWDPANPAHIGSFNYFYYLFGGFKGDASCLITGVAALNATQFQITLTRAFSPLPSILAMPSLAIASPAAIQAGTLVTTPIGSGPFTFAGWIPGDQIQLQANSSYWGDLPHVSALTFKVITTSNDQLVALQTNVVHIANNLLPNEQSIAKSDPNLRVVWRPSSNVGYLGINRAHSPLDNLLVRQAIAHAVNRAQIIANYYDPVAEADPYLLPSGIWGRDPSLTNYTYDPALSRTLLKQAGFPHGFTTTLSYRDVFRGYLPNPAQTVAAIAADLQAVGITSTVNLYSSGTFLAKAANGELDLYLLGWGADYLHPDNFFNPILCDGYLAFGPKDTALCNQLQTSLAEFNFNNLLTLYQWASRRVYDTLPLLPLAHTQSAIVIRREILGLTASPLGTEAYKDATFPTAWIYLPLIRK